ncbi:MAG: RnfH family protein [Magnetococcales bacterium]|nr:RnfH family protein [Magnetococcales bacterium]
MRVAVAYAEPGNQVLLEFEIPDGSTAEQAIRQSGVLGKFPGIDLEKQKVGIYGKVTPLDQVLQDGERVEIYRPALGKPPKKDGKAAKAGANAEGDAADDAGDAAGGEDKAAKQAAAKERAAAAKAKIAAKKAATANG